MVVALPSKSLKSGHEMSVPFLASGAVPAMTNSRSSSSTSGYGRSMTPSIQLRTAVFAPIPSARQRIASAENPGFRRSRRRPNRMSCSIVLHLVRLNQGTERATRAGHDDCGRRRDGHEPAARGRGAEDTERDAGVLMNTVFPRGEGEKSRNPACGSGRCARLLPPSSHELVPQREDQDDEARQDGHAAERAGAAHRELEPKRDDNGDGQAGGNSERVREQALHSIGDAKLRRDLGARPELRENFVERSARAGGVVEVGQQFAPQILSSATARDPRSRYHVFDEGRYAIAFSHGRPRGSPAWQPRSRSIAAA